MEISDILAEIRTFLTANANDERVKKYAYYFKEGFDAYGVEQELIFSRRDEYYKKYRDEIGMSGFIKLGSLLFESGKYEEGTLALLFLLKFSKEFDRTSFDAASSWLDNGIRNWAHSDYLCGDIMKALFKKNICSMEDMKVWSSSASKWKRRAVPVSMLYFLKSEMDFLPMLEIIRPMMHDKERVVHQGLGWFLREAWKKQPDVIEPFLMEFKNTSPRLIFQYATEKMTKEQKEKFRAEKKKKPARP